MFQIISVTSKTVSGTQNLERNVPTTAHKNVPVISLLLGILFLLVIPVLVPSGAMRVAASSNALFGAPRTVAFVHVAISRRTRLDTITFEPD